MKKTFILFSLISSTLFVTSQTRTSLYEEFTGENCNPCASTNPGLNTLLLSATNQSKVIPIKWQVPIPSAPSATWSLYRTNQAEIDWRYKPTTSGGYGYPQTLSTPTAGYINSAPNGRMDGQEMNAFGLTSNHPAYLNNTAISTAQSMTTNFSINMNTSWDATFSNCAVTVTVTSSTAFTAAGNLMYRLCLVERVINFNTPPGSNGEKDFYDAVRKSYPTTSTGTAVTTMGTILPGSWTAGQSQTFTVNCVIPSYIVDKGQMAFVGFIQDDGTKKIYQAARTSQPQIQNEAKALAVDVPSVACTIAIFPNAVVKNNGVNAITDLTVTPYLDGVTGSVVTWTGNLAPTATTSIPMNMIAPPAGPHTYSYNITGVSGGDIVPSNNTTKSQFLSSTAYAANPIVEGFTVSTFPPPMWTAFNVDGGVYTFTRSTLAGGYGTSSESVLFQVNSAANGDKDDLYLPPTDMSAMSMPELSFDLAYCQVSASNKDSLNVFVSNDCGTSWTKVFGNGSSAMATAPVNSSTFFVPTATQWTTVVTQLTAYANAPQILVKFQVIGNKGNRIFLDNINLKQMGTTSVQQNNLQGITFGISPNPANNEATVSMKSSSNSEVILSVTNTLGQLVYHQQHQVNPGENLIKLDCKDLATGLYMITISNGQSKQTGKLIIAK
ncbi:MAG: T9SS type A sorting domain-containing protein [Bacteroidia bacterium]